MPKCSLCGIKIDKRETNDLLFVGPVCNSHFVQWFEYTKKYYWLNKGRYEYLMKGRKRARHYNQLKLFNRKG